MECKTAQGLLEAYLDNELERTDARELEAHVDTCAECRAMLTRLDALRRALRDPALRHAAPPELRQRVVASTHTATTAAAHRGAPVWLRYAAACLLAFGAGGIAMRTWDTAPTSADEQIARDVFASHWRALAATSPVDVVSSDRHTVKPWFAGKVADAPLVQDFADQGFALAGGRIDYVGAARVPVLVYRHGQHVIDVFVLPAGATLAPQAATRQGYVLSPILLGGEPAAIVSDMDAQEQAAFGRLLAATK